MTDKRPIELAPEVRRGRMRREIRVVIELVALGVASAALAILGGVATFWLCGALL